MQLENDYENFGQIVSSKTGGQVYAVNRQDFWLVWTTKDLWKKKCDPGLIVFRGDACCLFRHHPIEGPWTGAKSALGQYVSASGAIRWHPQCPWPPHSKVLYVSDAWLEPGPGRPKKILWGRRLVSDQWVSTCLFPLFLLFECGYVDSAAIGAIGFGGLMAAISHILVRLLFWLNFRHQD